MDITVTMEQFPLEGETIIGKKMFKSPGGKGANQCIAAARLGACTEMVGMLGEDENAEVIRELFVSEGVAVNHVLSTSKEPTTIALIEVNAAGENRIVVVPAANFEYTVEDLYAIKKVIAESTLVLTQMEMRLDVVEKLAEMCEELGVPMILNPAPAVPLQDCLLKRISYLTPNETELAILTNHRTETAKDVKEAAGVLLKRGVKNVIATLGCQGALLANKDGMEIISGYPVRAIDTVAAGDAFNGALAKALADGKSLKEAVKFANAVGALTVTRCGAISSLPTLKEAEMFLKERNAK